MTNVVLLIPREIADEIEWSTRPRLKLEPEPSEGLIVTTIVALAVGISGLFWYGVWELGCVLARLVLS
jgi:hypothetical protein